MTTQEAIEKHFKDERTIYFQQSDMHILIEGDTYLRYQKENGVQLWLGGDNGEVCILFTRDGDILDRVISIITNPNQY